jgi:hypothetical protein
MLNKRLKFNNSFSFRTLVTRMTDRQVLNGLYTLAVPACYIGPALMIIGDIITIALNHGDSPVQETISWFAAGPFGWLEKLGMLTVAISFLFIAAHLLSIRDIRVKNQRDLRLLQADGILLAIVAFGFFLITIFNTNVIGTIVSFHGLVHQIATIMVSVVFYIACLILMRLLVKHPALKYAGFYSGLTLLVGFGVLFWLGLSNSRSEYMGLMERLVAGFNLVWIMLVGPQVIRLVNELRKESAPALN